MISPVAAAIRISWVRNASYALRLVEDVPAERFVNGLPLNHPAWIFSHLNAYAQIAIALARGQAFADPADHRYGAKSEPTPDPADYEPKSALLTAWSRLHDDGAQALDLASDAALAAPTPLGRWRTLHPTVGDMLVTLMVKHESGHLGQLSAWRRSLRLPRVPL
ncbi:MAG: DinB family protein [Phycisphaerales bacterium]